MFKAKLIENEKMYRLIQRQVWLVLIPTLPIAALINFKLTPLWLSIVMITVLVLTTIWSILTQKEINALKDKRFIEIDEEEIRIRSTKGEQFEMIPLSNVEELILPNEYSVSEIFLKQLFGKVKKNYIKLKQNEQNRIIYFELDSEYLVNQLSDVVSSWKRKNYNIIRSNISF